MPKINLLPKADYKAMSKNIQKAMVDREVNDLMELSNKVGWKYATTYYKVKRSPQNIKVADLVEISRVLKVPLESLIAGVVS